MTSIARPTLPWPGRRKKYDEEFLAANPETAKGGGPGDPVAVVGQAPPRPMRINIQPGWGGGGPVPVLPYGGERYGTDEGSEWGGGPEDEWGGGGGGAPPRTDPGGDGGSMFPGLFPPDSGGDGTDGDGGGGAPGGTGGTGGDGGDQGDEGDEGDAGTGGAGGGGGDGGGGGGGGGGGAGGGGGGGGPEGRKGGPGQARGGVGESKARGASAWLWNYARQAMQNPSRYDAELVRQGAQVIEASLGRIREQGQRSLGELYAARGLTGSSLEMEGSSRFEQELQRLANERLFQLGREQATTYAQDRASTFGLGLGSGGLMNTIEGRMQNEIFRRRYAGEQLDIGRQQAAAQQNMAKMQFLSNLEAAYPGVLETLGLTGEFEELFQQYNPGDISPYWRPGPPTVRTG